jgi:hypothetical protein
VRHRNRILVAIVVAPLALLGACGDDDDGNGNGNGNEEAGASTEAYCAMTEELSETDDMPSPAELEQLAAVAPPEIRDDVEAVVDALGGIEDEDEGAAVILEQPDLIDRFERIEAFEAEHCRGDGDGLTDGESPAEDDDGGGADEADE